MRSPKRSSLLRFLPDRLWRRSRGWGRWVRWPPTPSMNSRGRPRIGLRTCAGGLIASSSDLEVTLSLESVQNHYISPFPMFPKNLAFYYRADSRDSDFSVFGDFGVSGNDVRALKQTFSARRKSGFSWSDRRRTSRQYENVFWILRSYNLSSIQTGVQQPQQKVKYLNR